MIAVTEAALAKIADLVARFGPLMFHQSGGCCDGSAPMCFQRGELVLGERDVLLGEAGGRGASFSLEIPDGVRFMIRSDVCTV